jgi:TPP-dependent pyruvate/acetoin dehydrogenase alpha subunit
LLEAETYRWQGHYEGDPQTYKPAEEADAWRARDPLLITRARIASESLASDDELDAVLRDAEERIARAEAFARSSPYPELTEILTDVYGD